MNYYLVRNFLIVMTLICFGVAGVAFLTGNSQTDDFTYIGWNCDEGFEKNQSIYTTLEYQAKVEYNRHPKQVEVVGSSIDCNLYQVKLSDGSYRTLNKYWLTDQKPQNRFEGLTPDHEITLVFEDVMFMEDGVVCGSLVSSEEMPQTLFTQIRFFAVDNQEDWVLAVLLELNTVCYKPGLFMDGDLVNAVFVTNDFEGVDLGELYLVNIEILSMELPDPTLADESNA